MANDGSLQFDTNIDSNGFQKGVNKLGNIVETGLGVLTGNLLTSLVDSIKKIGEAAISAGGELQQSIGGIETLFGAGGAKSVEEYAEKVGKSVADVKDEYNSLMEAQQTALANADMAYQTAGLSANDYMQTVTGFAAALKQSTETELEAAEAANQAVIDMADNANKMGTDMGSIQQAYQGFAKQNYTMLDNLKLGYGGTKTEMQRLLKDAEKLTGKEYNLDNLADVYEAIHVIQDELGITGTTAMEASSTLQGSFKAMESAAENLLGKMALGEDIGPALGQLTETTITYLGNLLPMIGNLLQGIPAIFQAALETSLPLIQEAFGQIIPGLQAALTEQGPVLMEQGMQLLENILMGVADGLPVLLTTGYDILTQLCLGILENLPSLITQGLHLITTFVDTLMSHLPEILASGAEMILNLVNGIIQNLPEIVTAAVSGIVEYLATIGEHLPEILQKGIEIIGELAAGLIQAIPDLLATLPQLFSDVCAEIGSYDWLSIGENILTGIADGIAAAVGTVVDAAKSAGESILNGFKDFFGIHSPSTVMEEQGQMLMEGVSNGMQGMPDAIGGILGGALEGVTSWGTDLVSGGLSAVNGFLSNVMGGMQTVPDQIGGTLNGSLASLDGWSTQLNAKAKAAVASMGASISAGFNGMGARIRPALTSSNAAVTAWGSSMSAKFRATTAQILTVTQSGFSQIPPKVKTYLNLVLTTSIAWGTQMTSRYRQTVQNILNAVQTGFSQLTGKITPYLNDALKAVNEWSGKMASAGSAAGQGCADAVKNGVSGLYGAMKSVGKSAAQGIGDGISANTGYIQRKARAAAAAALAAAKDEIDSHSPSKRFKNEVGKMMALGTGLGFTENMGPVTEDMRASLNNSIKRLRVTAASIRSAGGNIAVTASSDVSKQGFDYDEWEDRQRQLNKQRDNRPIYIGSERVNAALPKGARPRVVG